MDLVHTCVVRDSRNTLRAVMELAPTCKAIQYLLNTSLTHAPVAGWLGTFRIEEEDVAFKHKSLLWIVDNPVAQYYGIEAHATSTLHYVREVEEWKTRRSLAWERQGILKVEVY